jgi:phosphoesterase RecJ-like protein
MKQILDQLLKSRTVLVASHTHPDGDAVGALLATGLALQSLHKDVRMYNESPIPAVYRFLPSMSSIMQQLGPVDAYDSVVVLDCGDLDRVGEAAPKLRKASMIINIDHHITNTRFGHLQLIDPEACATAEIVYRLIKALPVQIDCAMATAIYTGILTDTGSFRFSNTNQSAFAICSQMIEAGADPYEVAQYVYGTYSLGRIKLLNLALDSLEISPNGKLSVMTLTRNMLKETGTQPQDIDGLINYARRIEAVKVAALIHEVDRNGNTPVNGKMYYHVSLRSDGSVDVSKIAAMFGGGGHTSAAGFSIELPLVDLKARIFQLSETIPGLCKVN